MITKERLISVLDYDKETGHFRWKINGRGRIKIGAIAGYNQKGYLGISIDGRTYGAHRLAWLYVYGSFPNDELDHINQVKNDNRLCNLRDVNHIDNVRNQFIPRKHNKSGFIGVCKYKDKWQALIKVSGKTTNLGLYTKPELANEAYLCAKLKYHGVSHVTV